MWLPSYDVELSHATAPPLLGYACRYEQTAADADAIETQTHVGVVVVGRVLTPRLQRHWFSVDCLCNYVIPTRFAVHMVSTSAIDVDKRFSSMLDVASASVPRLL